MRIRKKKWAEPELSVCDFYVAEPEKLRGNWKSFFKNDKPIMLEVGCGKGSFVGQMALKHPEINFIAVDIKLGGRVPSTTSGVSPIPESSGFTESFSRAATRCISRPTTTDFSRIRSNI